MRQMKWICLFFFIIACYFQVNGADKYTDENRPYEFGFTIDGEQHRHEKKDENGIIMGEFGFITADGVYHVTVYATDENGNFKIISMKNIRVKPYPTSPGVKKGHSIPFPPSEQSAQTQSPVNQVNQKVQEKSSPAISSPAKSCSHCSLPATTTVAPKLKQIAKISTNENPLNNYPSNNYNNPLQTNKNAQDSYVQNIPPPNAQSYPEQGLIQRDLLAPHQNYPNQISNDPQNNANKPNTGFTRGSDFEQNIPSSYNTPQNYPENAGKTGSGPNYSLNMESVYPQNDLQQRGIEGQSKTNVGQSLQSERNPKTFNQFLQESLSPEEQYSSPGTPNVLRPTLPAGPPPDKPILIAAQMEVVDRNTDVHHKNPGETEGLPKGLTTGDMTQLLYTFNYTLGFHGHHEKGYLNGAKQGYYFVTGRNGIRTRIDYTADETGFHPKISQEVLDIISDEVPKPETEKDEKYGLKGYEFKWIYFPVESKQK